MPREHGHVGVSVGTTFKGWKDLAASGVHTGTTRDIWGTNDDAAYSIVMNGGYGEDKDAGTLIKYVGEGRDADQTLTGGNKHLDKSRVNDSLVRVIRGYRLKSSYKPDSGYRYDGLYRILHRQWITGEDGYKKVLFTMEDVNPSACPWEDEWEEVPEPMPAGAPSRATITSSRIIRDTKRSASIKRLYNHTCQVCGVQLMTSSGPYSEGAHIRPLSGGHVGPDHESNILCLCPNHHTLYDKGAFVVEHDMTLTDIAGFSVSGNFTVKQVHNINTDHLAYHRSMW